MIKTTLAAAATISALAVGMAAVTSAPTAWATNRRINATPTSASHTAHISSSAGPTVHALLAQADALLAAPADSATAPSPGDIVNAAVASATTLLNGVVTTVGIAFGSVAQGVAPSAINAMAVSQETAVLYHQAAIFGAYTEMLGADAGATLPALSNALRGGIF